MILLDTDSCSMLIRGGSKRLDARVRALTPRDVCISAVTRAELLGGLAGKPEADALEDLVHTFLGQVRSLPWSNDAATHYVNIRAHLESRGEAVAEMDQMVAAHARSLGVPLVAGNSKPFKRIPGLEVLDWS